jgi:hypothetical protein
MFSLDRFYSILHDNLVSQFTNGRSVYYYPFGTYQQRNILQDKTDTVESAISNQNLNFEKTWFHSYFFDQEPIYDYTLPIVKKSTIFHERFAGPRRINILANSEHSNIKSQFVKTENYYDWYYFFHGFATLDWYRDFQYLQPSTFDHFDKVFICLNHLISKYRSYRLHLVSNLLEHNLQDQGHLSLFLKDDLGSWQDEVNDHASLLSQQAKIKIAQQLGNLTAPLVVDTATPVGSLSASVNIDLLTSALFHIVTETVYFQPKLHLTEKVFKPMVAKRPFLLVAAPGNLEYLKSYGFRTFDRWIDESYDQETDHYVRIEKITAEIKRLCDLPPQQLTQMHTEMKETLEYNFDHFYGNFKNIIVDELVDNFDHVLCQINNGRQPGNHSRHHQRFELPAGYLEQVKIRLKQ